MRLLFPVAVGLVSVAVAATVAAQGRPTYRVIVNPGNPTTSIDRKSLADLFLKKATRWGHDQAARPVDLDAGSGIRHRFSEEVLDRSIAAVKTYWQQLIFSGREVPPPELDSDDAVVGYVLKHPGGVGYVSGGANLNGAKVLVVR